MENQNYINEKDKSYKSLIKEIKKLESDKERNRKKKEQLDQEDKLIDVKLKELYQFKQSLNKVFEGINHYHSKYNHETINKDESHV